MAPPPDLIDDAINEILLRLPPDEPACLFRAAVVCKLWRRVLSDPAFSHRYREFHRTPPLLGFHHKTFRHGYGFVPTTAAASPFPHEVLKENNWWISDCRHGGVLVQHMHEYIMWDPITGNREELRRSDTVPYVCHTAAVCCAVAGCDHRGCHGSPFLIIFMCTHSHGMHVFLYSSKTRAWGMPLFVPGNGGCGFDKKRGAFTRDNSYYSNVSYEDKFVIAKYKLSNHSLSMIDPPDNYKTYPLLTPNEDGSLGLAVNKGSRLYLWSRTVNTSGIDEWMQWRVIEFDKLLPICKPYCDHVYVSGFAEDVGLIFLTTINHVVFTFELKSGIVRKVSELGEHYAAIFPFMSFYTPGAQVQLLKDHFQHDKRRSVTKPGLVTHFFLQLMKAVTRAFN